MAAQRKNRGFYPSKSKSSGKGGKTSGKSGKPVLSIQDIKDKTRCRKCNKLGHWARECPQNKGKGGTSYTAEVYTGEETELQHQAAVFPEQGALFVSEHTPAHEFAYENGLAVGSPDGAAELFHAYIERNPSSLNQCRSRSRGLGMKARDFGASLSLFDFLHQHVSDEPGDLSNLSASKSETISCQSCYMSVPQGASSDTRPPGAYIDTGCTRCLVGEETVK
eukprot:2521370-Amphidinium_carterae.1